MSDIAALAGELVRLGTRCVFGIPGEGPSLLFLDELEKLGGRFHLVSHEAAGALMAGGFGRVAGIPGVSISIKGPGFCNMLSGIASNWLDRNPALSLSESYGPHSSPYRMHKRIDHSAMAAPVVKAYGNNISPDLIGQMWDLCLEEEPGPVHLDISDRMEERRFSKPSAAAIEVGDLSREMVRRIQDAQRPVLIAGSLAGRRTWRGRLRSLRIPVFTTFAGKGALDETLPFSAGVFTNSGGPFAPESKILPLADLAVGLGLRATEILDVKPLPVPLIVLDELPGKADGLSPLLEANAAAESFDEALSLLESKEWGASEICAAKAMLEKKLRPCDWLPAGCFQMLQTILPETTMFFLDTGSFCTVGEHILKARHPRHVMGSSQARSMGASLPAGVGASLARPECLTVVVAGDGGVRMYPEVMHLAVRERLPFLLLLMTDGSFSSIRREALRKNVSQNSLYLDSSCWTGVFEKLGCRSGRIASMAVLEQTLRDWVTSPQPLFLELAFERSDYLAMTNGLR